MSRFVTILMNFQHSAVPNDPPTSFFKDEKVSVSDEEAKYFCANGWAKDETGQIPTGVPNQKEVRLEMHGVTHGQASTKVGS